MPTMHPHLMFEGRAEEAIDFYVSLFPDGERLETKHQENGKIFLATFRVAGQLIAAIDSPVPHGFTFTPAMSLFVMCDDEAQLDKLFAALEPDGKTLMPLGDYGFSKKFGWVQDRFGVSWQLNLP